MISTKIRLAAGLAGLLLVTAQIRASVVPFVGEDLEPTANPTVRTNSDAAEAAFTAAASGLGQVSTITFETAPLGSLSNLSLAPGVTINGTDYQGNPQTIRDTSNYPSYPSVDGTNTTLGGSQFAEMLGGTLVFSFSQPTQFFGAYLTGVQTNFFTDTISFSDGTSQSITLAGTGTSGTEGETAFVGFTDAGKSITGVSITASNQNGWDFIGVDDVKYESVPSTPLPSSAVMGSILFGIVGVAASWKRLTRKSVA